MAKRKENEETTKILEERTQEGKRIITITKGTKTIKRLEHDTYSWMLPEK